MLRRTKERNRRMEGVLGQKLDAFETESLMVKKYANEDIRRKMLELAIELHYLAADGKLNDPVRVQALLKMLEECAQIESGDPRARHFQAASPIPLMSIS